MASSEFVSRVLYCLLLAALTGTLPTIVIAHTFCASRDTRVSYQ